MLHLGVLLFYVFLSGVFLRPLFPVWNSAIPGGLEDTRLFLWNAWWFRHAIHTLHINPFYTRLLFHPFGSSLVSHDFPLWTNLVSYASQAAGLNLVAASNLWFVLSWILAGFFTYLLAAEVIRSQAPGLRAEPWQLSPAVVAGLYVMTHSYTLARAMQNWGQFNLYGIALFLWLFVRARRLKRTQDYVLAGVALAWTAACHYYFLIYSAAIWLAVAAIDLSPWRINIEKGPQNRAFLILVALGGAGAAWIIFLHPGSLTMGHVRIGL